MQQSHRITRRNFLRSAAVSVVGLGIVACAPAVAPSAPAAESGSSEGSQPAGDQVTLAFVSQTINEGHITVRDKWSQEFMEANPNVKIDHQTIPADQYQVKIQTLYAAGTPPDVYCYLQEHTPIITVAQKQMHLPLNDYIERDSLDLSDFRPDALNLYRWDDVLYALPRDYGNQNVYYNLDLFEADGIATPPADWEDTTWTFDTFLETAKALTKSADGRTDQWGFLVNRGQRPWASWLYSNGGALVHLDDRGVSTDSAMTDEASVQALQFAQDLIHTHKVAPTPDIESELGGFELFASGRVGMMINNPSAVNRYRTIETFRWNVATLPLGATERRGTGGGGTGWGSGAATAAPDIAWEFIKHITTPEAELDEVAVGATTPARVSVVTSPEFLNPDLAPENAAAFAQAQEYVVRDPVHVLWPEIAQRIYNPKMDILWSGAENAASVAQQIKDESDPLFAREE
jgi:multiple sugar transport system substrate-binding protein